MISFLNLKKINLTYKEEILNKISTLVDSGWYIRGELCARFEEEFASYCGTKFCVGVASGLDALSLIFRAYKEIGYMKDNDELKKHLKELFNEGLVFTDKKGVLLKLNDKDSLKLELKKNRSNVFNGVNIYFSAKNKHEFYVKKKSKTNNPTLIFSIEFHNKNNDDDLQKLHSMIINS